MKFKVFKEKKEKTSTTHLKLEQSNKDVVLIACDENGKRLIGGNILLIKKEGILLRCGNVSKKLGLELDKNFKIKSS